MYFDTFLERNEFIQNSSDENNPKYTINKSVLDKLEKSEKLTDLGKYKKYETEHGYFLLKFEKIDIDITNEFIDKLNKHFFVKY